MNFAGLVEGGGLLPPAASVSSIAIERSTPNEGDPGLGRSLGVSKATTTPHGCSLN